MTIMPAMLISSVSILVNGFFFSAGFFDLFGGKDIIEITSIAMMKSVGWYYGILFLLGLITTLTEWKSIHCADWKKVAYTFTFPLFMFTYIPISVVALFSDVEWKPIAHTVVKSLDDVQVIKYVCKLNSLVVKGLPSDERVYCGFR